MRARYAVEPLGHYGLAKTKYAHFTSPIRRYADLVVHRALFDKKAAITALLKETAEHLSLTERNSADAERDSKEVKLYAYLKAQLESGELQTYPALVTDVRNFGFFVDVPTLGMSGLVHLSSIPNEFFVFDPARSELTGRPSRRVIKLGDNLDVHVWRVDSFKKQVDFQLAGMEGGKKPAGRPPEGARRSPASSKRGRSRQEPAKAQRKRSGPREKSRR